MAKKYGLQTRIIRVPHPNMAGVVLFEAHVKIVNLRKDLVEKIQGVNVKYKLKLIQS